MDVLSKDAHFCQSHPVYLGINLISTLIFERRLLIPFQAKKDVFQENGRHLKRRLFFLKDVCFLERRPLRPSFRKKMSFLRNMPGSATASNHMKGRSRPGT